MKYALIENRKNGPAVERDFGEFERIANTYLALSESDPLISEYLLIVDTNDEEVFFEEMSVDEIDAHLSSSLKHWEICGRCRGEGTCLIDGLENVAFTRDEFDEMFDPDEQDRYFNGGYDRSCPDCNGTGKVKVVDLDRLATVAPFLSKHRREWLDDAYETQMLYEAERRMGA